MHDFAKATLLRLLRVPSAPKPPEGSPESIRIFRAGRNYYRWRLLQWGALQLIIALWFLSPVPIAARRLAPPKRYSTIWEVFEYVSGTAFLLSLPITFFKQRLDYEMRWYIVTDRSLRVRSGIWSVQELTTTFANIQDIRISAGPLQRFLQLADVMVTSAGGGGGKEQAGTAHSANLSGVDCAEAIRDLIVERLRQYRDAGLGDPDDQSKTTPTNGEAVAAARRVLTEAKALRAALTAAPI